MGAKTAKWVLGAICVTSVLSACSSSSSSNTLSVSASFYPIAEIVRTVGGDLVDVQDLTPIGHDAHETELTAKQLQRLEKSSVVFYFGDDFQPGSQKAIESLPTTRIIDLFSPLERNAIQFAVKRKGLGPTCAGCEASSELDPHVWLDPANMITLTSMVQEELTARAPEQKDIFAANANSYIQKLSALGSQIGSSFQKCESKVLATAHNSFGYFATRAHLLPIPLAGYSPDQTISGKELQSLTSSLKKYGVITIFDEPALESDLVKEVAKNIGASVDSLNAVESITDEQLSAGDSYLSIMNGNIQKMKKALRCS